MHVEFIHATKRFRGPGKSRIGGIVNLSFSAEEGDIIGIIGPNGAGKSTTIKLMLSLLSPDEGKVNIRNSSIPATPYSYFGYLPEERGLYQDQNVIETVSYFAHIQGLKRRDAVTRARKWIKCFGLEKYSTTKIRKLSKGLSQKVQLASTLVHEPQLVVLDEPFSGLDPMAVRQLRGIIASLKANGTLVVLTTHRISEVEMLCNKILILENSQKIYDGTVEELKKHYATNQVIINQAKENIYSDLVNEITPVSGFSLITLKEDLTPRHFLSAILERGAEVTHFQVALPSLEEIISKLYHDVTPHMENGEHLYAVENCSI